MIEPISRFRFLGPIVLRVGLALVFLCFSYYQFSNPTMWTGFVPKAISGIVGGNAGLIVTMNAWFELVAGLMLLIGFQTRTVALLLAIHLVGIAGSIGFSPLGVRDSGLSIATLAIFFNGADLWSLDRKFRRPESPVPNI